MIRRLRLLLPHDIVIVPLLVFHLVTVGLHLLLFRHFQATEEAAGRVLLAAMVLATMFQGAYRVIAFHPFYNADYREWLGRAPWHWPRPLPAGPIHLVWEDAVILGTFTGVTWYEAGLSAFVLPLVFLGVRAAFLMETFFLTGQRGHGWIIAFGFGWLVWTRSRSPLLIGSTAVLTLVAELGLRASMRAFPWGDCRSLFLRTCEPEAILSKGLGWPYQGLGPLDEPGVLKGREKALVALLAGWSVFTMSSLASLAEDRVLIIQYAWGFSGMAAVLGRLTTYLPGTDGPLSLAGRIRLGRWIIPGYDRLFLGPVAALIICGAGPFAFHRQGASWPVAFSATITLVVFVALTARPSLAAWRLTCDVRTRPRGITREHVRVG